MPIGFSALDLIHVFWQSPMVYVNSWSKYYEWTANADRLHRKSFN